MSSLVSEFSQRIQIQDLCVCAGGGGGGGGGEGGHEHKSHHILYTQDTLSQPLLSHENIPIGIQNRGHCSFNHQGKLTQKV